MGARFREHVSITLIMLLSCLISGCNPKHSTELPISLETNGFYIWQRLWDADLQDGIERASSDASMWFVLSGEFDYVNEEVDYIPISVNWQSFAAYKVPITLVFRANVSMLPTITDELKCIEIIAHTIRKTLEEAAGFSTQVSGIQLDFDCPTRALAEYAEGIRALHDIFPNYSWSITALPSWFSNPDVSTLMSEVDFYVLQLHSFEAPKQIDDNVSIFPAQSFSEHLSKAERLKRPFVLSLPTYGYEVGYDQHGKFAGLKAEMGSGDWPPGYTSKKFVSRTDDISSALKLLDSNPPAHYCGVVWFRLPIPGDRFNWSWETLSAVRTGMKPTYEFSTEIESPKRELVDVFVKTTGDVEAGRVVLLTITGHISALAAKDSMNGYSIQSVRKNALVLKGPAPAPGKRLQVAWLRFTANFPDDLKITVAEE